MSELYSLCQLHIAEESTVHWPINFPATRLFTLCACLLASRASEVTQLGCLVVSQYEHA